MTTLRINPARPIDSTVASTGNGWHLRRMTDRAHAGQSILSVCRQVRQGFRPGAMRHVLPEVKRAIWQVVIEQHLSNRELFRRVMAGDLTIER
jgi:hypothetical protein